VCVWCVCVCVINRKKGREGERVRVRKKGSEREREREIGYLSADLCDHSVSYFFEAVVAHRDWSLPYLQPKV